MKSNRSRFLFFLLTFSFLLVSRVSAQTLTVREIMAEPSIAGMRAEAERLSPDGSKVAYLWNADGKMPRDIYIVPAIGGAAKRIIGPRELPTPTSSPAPENKLGYGLQLRDEFTKERENPIGALEWSPDSSKLIFTQNGDVFVLTVSDGKAVRITKTQSPEGGARFLDNDRILFQQNGNLFILNTRNATLIQVSKEANQQNFISVSNATPNKAASLIAYMVSDNSKQRALVVPNY